MGGLKIRRIHLRGFQQFQDTVLDFTNPDTGEVADRICFIGRNGTGKSTILRLIDDWLRSPLDAPRGGHTITTIEVGDRRLMQFASVKAPGTTPSLAGGQSNSGWIDVTGDASREADILRFEGLEEGYYLMPGDPAPVAKPDLVVVQRVDVHVNQGPSLADVPETSLSAALGLMRDFPIRHEVSDAAVTEMWRLLVFLVKLRESERQAFEVLPENINKTKANLIAEFDAVNRPVLEGLAKLWNRILQPAGLEFDVAGARIPIQLNENLQAFIRHKESGERIAYSALSTGIRNFLFRTGHLFLLYFNRKVERDRKSVV